MVKLGSLAHIHNLHTPAQKVNLCECKSQSMENCVRLALFEHGQQAREIDDERGLFGGYAE